jgi:hypothetical protein
MILLFFQILLDASGDAFRLKGWQKLQHSFESLQIIVWFWIAWLLTNNQFHHWQELALLYISARFVFFDAIFKVWTKQPISYVGLPETSLYAYILDLIFVKTKFATAESGANTLKLLAFMVMICEIYNLWSII